MTRCADFYEKWEKFPNWCEKTKGAVSRINSYLSYVHTLEDLGVDKVLTFGNLPESRLRALNTMHADRQHETIVDIAEVLLDESLDKKERTVAITETINHTAQKIIRKKREEQEKVEREAAYQQELKADAKVILSKERHFKVDDKTTLEAWRRSMLELAFYEPEPIDLWDNELGEPRPEWAAVAELALNLLSDILNDIDTLGGFGGKSRLQAYAARLLGGVPSS